MDIIYEPRGRAKEYALLAANLYKGCTHGCKYCFGPSTLFKAKEKYFELANPKKNVIQRMRKDCERLTLFCVGHIFKAPEILLSFIGDVYQYAETDLGLTRQAIELLIEYDLPFTILTKGGTRAVRDFDLLESYNKARFGTTLVFTDQKDADEWEPGAASIEDRINAIREAHQRGISTWISLEPVIIPEQAFELIKELHPIVDHWKVGKVNYVKNNVDWIDFRQKVTDLLNSIGADYYLKKSLIDQKAQVKNKSGRP